jgi:hypothetical protein
LKPEEVEIHKIEEIKYDFEETPEQIAQLQKQQDELSALRRELLEMKNRPLATDGTEKTALKEVIEFRGNRRFLNRNVLVDN